MRTFHLSRSSLGNLTDIQPNVTAVGFFDGIHKGHQQVIETAMLKAEQSNLKSAVMTFDPHPSVVLKKEKQHAHYITPLPEKGEILTGMGVDYLFVITFNKALASLSPQQFVDDYFVKLNVKHVVAGFDFSYGHKGQGSMDTLRDHAKGRFTQTVIGKIEKDEEKVSSSRIRILLDEGNVTEANELLGRAFSVNGYVLPGTKLGGTKGYVTANVEVTHSYYLPKAGVYAVTVFHNGERYYGMTNLGSHPHFKGPLDKAEMNVHIFDIDPEPDLSGQLLTIQFHKWIRKETQSNGIREIKSQLKKDEAYIRRFFRIG